eukprot:gene9568-1720_t
MRNNLSEQGSNEGKVKGPPQSPSTTLVVPVSVMQSPLYQPLPPGNTLIKMLWPGWMGWVLHHTYVGCVMLVCLFALWAYGAVFSSTMAAVIHFGTCPEGCLPINVFLVPNSNITGSSPLLKSSSVPGKISGKHLFDLVGADGVALPRSQVLPHTTSHSLCPSLTSSSLEACSPHATLAHHTHPLGCW